MMDNQLEPQNIVAFIHTYQVDGKFDPYMTEVIDAFKNIGLTVYVIRTNDLVSSLSATHYASGVNINNLIQFINDLNPLFLFSTNRGGITQEIMKNTSCPIITRMVDLVPFYHQGGEDVPLFCDRDYVFVPTLESVGSFEKKYPIIEGKVFYLPFATDPHAFDEMTIVEKDIPISFVGTYFYAELITRILSDLESNSALRRIFLQLVNDIGNNFHLQIDDMEYAEEAIKICSKFGIDKETLRIQVSNIHALNKRIHYLDAVSDLGLQLFGTSNWIEVAPFSMRLFQCFQFDAFIDNREKLRSLYNRSKIALNIPHHQAGAGMPYRVYDIMASSALLITEYNEDSELFSLFGEDMPVPMYKNSTELRELVLYYLEHEEERKTIVKKCNRLIVQQGVSFENRAKEYCKVAKVKNNASQIGEVLYPRLNFRGNMDTASKIGETLADSPKKMSISLKLLKYSQWLLPYNVYIRLQAKWGRSAEIRNGPRTVGKLKIRVPFNMTKLKVVAKWVIPFRIHEILSAYIRIR